MTGERQKKNAKILYQSEEQALMAYSMANSYSIGDYLNHSLAERGVFRA